MKRLTKRACAALAAVALAAPASALPPRPAIEVLALEASAAGLGGPGAARLRAALQEAQFVALGEDHGFAEAPRLGAALAAELARIEGAPIHHAVEVGPAATAQIGAMLRRNGLLPLDRLLDAQPHAVPFLSNREDAELALPFARAGRLWGIDQEFIGSTALLCDQLIARTRDPGARRQLAAWRDADRAALQAGAFDKAVLTTTDPAAFAALKPQFGADREAAGMLDALAASARIYQFNAAERYFENNQERATLMFATFLDRYRAAKGPAPRVVLKMGAYHLGRGITPTSIFDIGSMLPGLAAAQGKQSVHIAFVPLGGNVRGISPSAQGFTAVSDYQDEIVGKLLAAGGIAPERVPASGLVLIPLEPLRQQMGGKARRELPEFARFLLLGYDYLVTTRAATAATHFEAWNPGTEVAP